MKNKYQEALINLVHCKSETKCKECKYKYRCTMERDSNILQELVDKETPMKPLKLIEGDFCRNCKYEIPENVEKYCPHCGQKLDWEVE